MAAGTHDLNELLEHAREQGARGTEILSTETDGAIVEVQRGKVTRSDAYREQSLSVRVWDEEGREGSASGPRIDPALVDEAIAKMARAEPDPFGGPVGRLSGPAGGLGIDDKRHAQLTPADRTDVVLSAEKGARSADRRARTEGFRYTDGRTLRRFVNTRGLRLEEWSTLYRAEGTVAIGNGDEVTLSDQLASRAFASIASLPYGAMLAHRCAALYGPGPELEGPIATMLPPRVVAGLLERLGPLFDPAVLPTSFLSRRRPELPPSERPFDWVADPNPPTLDEQLHLLDDGTMAGSVRTTMFDDRGVTPVTLTLLREGRVDQTLLAPNAARSRETRPTGHWHGGRLRPNNLILRGGTRSMNAILSESDTRVLMLDHVDWSGANLRTGQARLRGAGQLLRKGQTEGPVRDLVLVGDLLEVLNRVTEIASDTDRDRYIDAPGMLVEGFTVQRLR